LQALFGRHISHAKRWHDYDLHICWKALNVSYRLQVESQFYDLIDGPKPQKTKTGQNRVPAYTICKND